ncbi:MAG: methanol/ethanol family PQQ-dependent dehydrogenase, partial [Gemmatimonadota bacterium]
DPQEGLLSKMSNPNSWVHTGRTYSLQRYSPLSRINKDNVDQLKVSWTFSTGELRGHEGEPLVIGDTMYVHTPFPNKVYALDLSRAGSPIIWQYTPDQPEEVIPVACCDVVNRGVAWHPSGKIFIQTLDAHILALDADTGERLWKTQNGDYTEGETMTNAPLVVRDKVIVGISGGEFGVRGHVTAYDVETGERDWRAYSTGPDDDVLLCEDTFDPPYDWMEGEDLGMTTWEDPAPDEWERGGGTTWGWYSYDPELDLFYYGTGNPGTWNPDQRPGDNLWSMTIFARDPDTGCAHWAYQMTPHDEWDYDGVNENILVDQEIDGEERKTLVHFDRNGFAYTLDRETGEVLVAEEYGPVNWADGIDLETGRPDRNPEYGTSAGENTTGICPAAMGFKDQEPASYSPKTGLFYVPANHICMNYEGVEVQYAAGQPYVGAIVEMYPGPGGHRGRLVAWDATKGEVAWEIQEQVGTYGGTLATAGGVVFYTTLDGWVKAADAETGAVLWKFKAPSGIIGNVMTYVGPDGKQHVAVLSGVGGWPGIGVAADIGPEDPTEGLGALGAWGDLARHTNKAGVLLDFTLP